MFVEGIVPGGYEQVRGFCESAARVKRFADEHQVLVEGHVGSVGTTACNLMGMESFIEEAVLRPDFVQELLEIIQEWQMAGLEELLQARIADMVVVNGFYESLQLWSPALYRKLFFQPFRDKIEMIHQAGTKCAYNMTSRLMPLVGAFRELGFDVLRYLDPVQGEPDLVGLKREIGDQLCFLGGVNGTLTVGHGTPEEVREAVRRAIRTLGPGGGLILSASDAIYKDAPWENVVAMIEAWRETDSYPLEPCRFSL